MVAIVGDGGEKYLDTVFNDEWMTSKKLFDETVEEELEEIIDNFHIVPEQAEAISLQ
jgi:cystathionine beta-synthase